MQSSLTLSGMAALFGVMAVLAVIPSVSVMTVTARSAACGFVHGAVTAIGIVVGDVLYILLAIFGLSVLAETMGSLFVMVKYLGGAYLVWLGIGLWRSKARAVKPEAVRETSLLSSFLSGLFITLGDQKAILFYLGFLPAFVDLSAISYLDTGIIIVIAVIAVGGVKLGYAFMADKVSVLAGAGAKQGINIIAGSVMIAVGVFLVLKA